MDSTLLILLACVLQSTFAYPSGPPVGSVDDLCETMNPSGHGDTTATGVAPYKIDITSTSYASGTEVQVTVRGISATFEGIFVQARRQDPKYGSMTEALGTFSKPDSSTQLLDCDATNNAWGHNDKTAKTEKTATWTAPNTDEGPIEFVATIVQGPKNVYWEGVKAEPMFYAGSKFDGKTLLTQLKLNRAKERADKYSILYFKQD